MMSHLRTTTIGFLLLASLACQHMGQNGTNGDGSEGPASSDPAATIDARTITIGELDDYIKEALFSEASSERNAAALYDLRLSNLREMLDELIVENAASAANLSTEDYLRKQVEDQGEVPEAEIATFFDDHIDQMGGRDLDPMREQIDAYLVEQRVLAVITDLKGEANTEILLEPTRVAIEAIGPSKGPDDAIVTIVEFSDFQCPFCERVVSTLEKLVVKYPTQVRIVFRNLPLNRIHSRAQAAAEAAACADKQEDFWGFHDLIFANNRALTDEDFEGHATELGLEMDAFRQCVQDRETQQIVDTDLAAADALQISGTPAFIINGIPLHGALSVEALSAVIDDEIARISSDGSTAIR